MFKSLKFRLTFLYVGIFAAFVAAFSIGIQALAATRGWRELDRDLERDARVFASLILEERAELAAGGHTPDNWLDELKGYPDLMHAMVAIYSADGRLLFQSPPLATAPRLDPPPRAGDSPRFRTVGLPLIHHPGNYRFFTFTFGEGGDPALVLEFSRSTVGIDRFLARMRLGLVGGTVLLLVLASVAGFLFVRRALQPIEEMAGLAREISAGDLARRIPIPKTEGEFRQLALTFNAMLSRLEEAFARMRTFTANAAHELRTPIMTIRSALETSVGRPAHDLQESIGDALEELGRLAEITEKLFLLARADAGRLVGATQEVNLSEIAREVAEALEGSAAQRGMSIRLDGGPSLVTGDQALLRRAVHNLVENAVKYGRDGGRISIRTRPSGLDVENEGSGIDSAHLGRLFDRFYRVDPARSNQPPGSGLGLALVKSIIEAHGGGVSVQSAGGMTLFRIDFQEVSIVKREDSRD